jgi:alpha-beta hydrolase superfamily lysophospholipase
LPPPNLIDDGPGSLIEVRPLTGIADFEDADAIAMRVIYRSTSGPNGAVTPVSGVVAVPPGKPPRGGWPVISFGHDMTGVASTCAPSGAPNMAGYAGLLRRMVQGGYVVVATDYQGLGVEGPPHSLIDTATLGNNLIDAVRAARRLVPDASNRWAAFGTGQGGLAAWAADERAATYGAGLDLVGAVALSPFADLSDLADVAANLTLKQNQYPLLVRLLQSLANTTPGFPIDDYRSGLAAERWDLLLTCAPHDPAEVVRTYREMRPDDLRPRSAAATDQLRQALKDAAVPGAAANMTAPMLVMYGTSDPLVPVAGIERSLIAGCSRDQPIEIMRRIGDTNTNNDLAYVTSLNWLTSRFDGVPTAKLCVGAA